MITTGPYRTVQKGWGREDWLANGPAYCGKLLHFDPGKRCSLHYHERKVETLSVISGVIFLDITDAEGGMATHAMRRGDQVTLQPYQAHRFTGGPEGGVLVEVSTQHFEDDSVRVERGD